MNLPSKVALSEAALSSAEVIEFMRPGQAGPAGRETGLTRSPQSIENMTEQETLESLLGYSCRTGDLKAVVATLLQTFGGLEALLHVSAKRLQPFTTCDEAIGPVLRLVGHALSLAITTAVTSQAVIADSATLMRYLRFSSGMRESETVRILYLDSSYRLISDEFISQGGRVAALTSLRDIARHASILSAKALILAHLRPTHDDAADDDDFDLFHRVRAMCGMLEVSHVEHLLVGRTGFQSLMESVT